MGADRSQAQAHVRLFQSEQAAVIGFWFPVFATSLSFIFEYELTLQATFLFSLFTELML